MFDLKRSFRSKFAWLFVFIAIVLPTFASARPFDWEQDEAQKRAPLPNARYVRSRNIDVKHLSLDLRFDWEKLIAIGRETITVSPLIEPLRTVTLDAGNMEFDSIKLLSGKTLQYSYDEKATKLDITLDRAYSFGENIVIVINYRTKNQAVNSKLAFGAFGGGLKFFKPTSEDPKAPKQIWSQGESEYNRFWFPSYDYPNDFRTTELRATVEKPLSVISNGRLVTVTPNRDGTRTFYWKMDQPYANYLTSIVVGEYAEVKGSYAGIPVSSYVYPSVLKEATFSTRTLPATVKLFSEKTGIKYPYAKYAQVMAYKFGGGMENITATTQTDTMIYDERSELDEDQEGLQSHELAHQWFGDYVTCRDWSDIWLNESFATFMETIWTENFKGHDEMLYSDIRGNQNGYFTAWNRGLRRPIVTKNYSDPDAVFDAYAYPRGGAVLHMLRKQLGDANFWRAINHYLKSNAHQPVETEDFRIAIEESTGQSMDAFFDQWLYKMGHPVFEVTQTYDAPAKQLTLNVKQTQKRVETSDYPQVDFFQTPVDIEIATASGAKIETVFIEPKAENIFTFSVNSKPLLIDFDNEGTLIKELKFEKSIEELAYQMSRDGDVLGRSWALEELRRKLQDDKTSAADQAKIRNAIVNRISSEKFWGLRRDAIEAILPARVSPLASVESPPPIDLNISVVVALRGALKDKDARVRAVAIAGLGRMNDEKFADEFASALSDRSYGVIDSASIALGKTKSASAYDALTRLVDQNSWKDRIRIAALRGLGALGDKRTFEIGYKYASDATQPENIRSAALSVVAASGKGDPRAYPLVLEVFKKALDSNNNQGMFESVVSIIRLADPRGQEVFDLLKKKYEKLPQVIAQISMFEKQFQDALGK